MAIKASNANIIRRNAAAVIQQNQTAQQPRNSAIIPLYSLFKPNGAVTSNPSPPARWLTQR